MPSAQEYAQRLLDESTRTLSPLVKGLEADFQSLQLDVSTALSRLAGKLDSLHKLELPTNGMVLTQIFEELSRHRDGEWSGIADFSQKLGKSETQEEILNLLLDQAFLYSSKLVLLVTRGEAVAGWSSRGFSENTARSLRSASFPRSESAAISDALATMNPAKLLETEGEVSLLDILQGEAPGPWRLFPMKAMRRPVAVLLAVESEGKQTNQAACSLLVDMAALRLENIALQILQKLQSIAPESPSATAYSASAPAPAEEAVVIEKKPPLAMGKIAEKVFEEPSGSMREPSADSIGGESAGFAALRTVAEAATVRSIPEVESEPVEERAAEAQVQVAEIADKIEPAVFDAAEAELKTGMEMIQTETLPATPAESAGAAVPTAREGPRLAEEERLHADAKRFARLLVSEIKLYNEQRVVEGRDNRDLYVRLKRDIDRSREMYEKRVAPSVSRRIDYFHDEIIRILGENDPLTLGSDYPGARIESQTI